MGFFKDRTMRIAQGGFGAMCRWATGKSLAGAGIGVLLAYHLHHKAWAWIGWVLIGLSILVSLPVIKLVFCKPMPDKPADPASDSPAG